MLYWLITIALTLKCFKNIQGRKFVVWNPSCWMKPGAPHNRSQLSWWQLPSCMARNMPGSLLRLSFSDPGVLFTERLPKKGSTFLEHSFCSLLWSRSDLRLYSRCAHLDRCLSSGPWPGLGHMPRCTHLNGHLANSPRSSPDHGKR